MRRIVTNGKLATWFVVRWLETHRKHTAWAPDAEKLPESRVRLAHGGISFEYVFGGTWRRDPSPDYRSDWTIFDENWAKIEDAELVVDGDGLRELDWAVVENALLHAEARHEDAFDEFSRRLARCLPTEKDENIHTLCDSRNYERRAIRESRKALRQVRALRKEIGL